ncbi:MAG: hypothetical protein QW597_05800 [Thermoplasmataceae archaeon]
MIDEKVTVVFADEDTQYAYFHTKTDNPTLYKFLERATDDLKSNLFCGIQIPKRQIPKSYAQKYRIDNLWKYNLPDAWRLVYSVAGSEIEIVTILMERFLTKNVKGDSTIGEFEYHANYLPEISTRSPRPDYSQGPEMLCLA